MAKPKRATKPPDKSNSQWIIETLLMFAPAPIRAIASSPMGSRIIMTLGAGLLATGAMSVDWKNGIPQLQFHKDKIGDATQHVADEMDKQGYSWPPNSNPGSLPGNNQQPNYPPQQQPNWPPQAPSQNYPPQNWPPQVPPQNYPPQNYPPQYPPPQNGSTLPPGYGYGYGQAQGQAYPPGYYR